MCDDVYVTHWEHLADIPIGIQFVFTWIYKGEVWSNTLKKTGEATFDYYNEDADTWEDYTEDLGILFYQMNRGRLTMISLVSARRRESE
jgi:hypothetical protein